MVQGRGAEVDFAGQVLDAQCFVVVLVQPVDGAGDTLALTVGDGDFIQVLALWAVQQAIENFAQRQGREHGDVAWVIQ
ncbi:hypothetical protein D9M68_786520 [compost metagenome]